MPRNSSGTMSGTNGPYTSGTVISSTAINARFADEEAELSDSLSRSGKGGMTAPLRTAPGTVAAPSFSYTSDTGTGTYLAAAGDLRMAVGGVDALKLIAGGINGPLIFPSGTTAIQVTLANGYLQLQGNLNATNATFAEVVINSTVARTAGNLLDVQNNAVDKLYVDYQGLLRLASQAAAIQPASIWTAIAPNAGWTAGSGLSYCKDAMGVVRVRGTVTFSTGAAATAFTLPAGFRPSTNRVFAGVDGTTSPASAVSMWIDSGGGFNLGPTGVNTHTYIVDAISYIAEA